eukprot:TRINITY_DN6797_c0_g1_i1.p1 TRINITY_DN6797_c0_g1~~TRINITY_DN6797_c0_g1_i1.p1  ORF type:complete len:654 (-),score=92.44 TRINITY_DN6797_c0_g1_i1:74-1954(-)
MAATTVAMWQLALLSLPLLAPTCSGLSLRILGSGAGSAGSDESARLVGDGPGRALYQINTIEMPPNRTGKHCITARMDKMTHSLSVDAGQKDQNSVAYACYNDSMNTTGWAVLEVETIDDMSIPLAVRSYCAGLIEGLLTARRIIEFHANVDNLLQKDIGANPAALKVVYDALRLTLITWEEFTGGDAMSEPTEDLPKQAWAALLQMRGLRDGNNLLIGEEGIEYLSMFQVMISNMHGEIPAILELYARSELVKSMLPTSLMQLFSSKSKSRVGEGPTDPASWPRWASHKPKGSAIVRRVGPLGSPEDLLAGHVTNGEYGEMLRIMKTYRLHFGTAVSDVTMSSYPGCVSSTDDYFVTGGGFVIMSTSLWLPHSGPDSRRPITSDGVPSFLKAIMATRLATQPRMWAKIYGYLKGAGSAKQWLILDYTKFKSLQPLANDTLWMVEALPRLQRANDVTHVLREGGFFEAHGVPHFHDIRLIYGLPAEGPGTYQEMRQAALLDKGATVSNLASAREVLTEMKTSRNEQIPIATRLDLDPSMPIPAGSIDAKVTSRCLALRLGLQARSGPPLTPAGEAFSWTDLDGSLSFEGWPSLGQVNSWDFPWVNVLPGEIQSPIVPAMAECEPTA